jgi:hypothetical protein
MRYAGSHKHLVHTECLFRYEEPVSPHLAAQLASESNGLKVRYYCLCNNLRCALTPFAGRNSIRQNLCQFHSEPHSELRVLVFPSYSLVY